MNSMEMQKFLELLKIKMVKNIYCEFSSGVPNRKNFIRRFLFKIPIPIQLNFGEPRKKQDGIVKKEEDYDLTIRG